MKNRKDQVNSDEYLELKQQLCQIDIKLEDLNEYLGEKHYIEYKDHFKKPFSVVLKDIRLVQIRIKMITT